MNQVNLLLLNDRRPFDAIVVRYAINDGEYIYPGLSTDSSGHFSFLVEDTYFSGKFLVTVNVFNDDCSSGMECVSFSETDDVWITVNNIKPNKPTQPNGKLSGVVGTPLAFSTSATDPNKEKLRYTFDWGDNSNNITDFRDSGANVVESHAWGNPGIYNIKVIATDSQGLDSEWSSFAVINIESSPLLSVTPDDFSFNFSNMNSGESSSKTFSISNSGGGTLTWSISDDQPWITANPATGTTGTITLNVETKGLTSGPYSGTITINSNGGMKKGSVSLNILELIQPDIIVTSKPSSIVPGETSEITIVVTGKDNQPIPDARVMLSTTPGSPGKIPTREALGRTDSNGIYKATFNASAEGTATINIIVRKDNLPEAKKDIRIIIQPKKVSASITGMIIDNKTGEPVSNTTVAFGNISVTTGPNGKYELMARIGEYNNLTITRPGYEPVTKSINIPEAGTVVNFSISPSPDTTRSWSWIIVILLLAGVSAGLFYAKNNKKISIDKDIPGSIESPSKKNKLTPEESPTGKPEINNSINIKSGYGYICANISYKVSLENSSSETVSDIRIELNVPDVFLLKENRKTIPLLQPGESQTVTFEIRPTGECGNCRVEGEIRYYDYSSKKHAKQEIQTKMVSVICPVLKRKEIDMKQWEKVTDELIKAEENIQELSVPAEILFSITSMVIKDNGMFMFDPEKTSTPQLFRGFARFYAEGTSGLRYAAYIEVVGGTQKSRLILKAWAQKDEALTGFYHRLLDGIEKRINVKIYIDDVQKYIHNEYVSGDKIGRDQVGTQINDSFMKNSTIESGGKKV